MNQLTPIGFFRGPLRFRQEAPRQGVLVPQGFAVAGRIELAPDRNFEQALRGLIAFERIWVLFGFNQNEGENSTTVRPPGSEESVGTFATRSPYRPNSLGMSCVRLDRVVGREVFVSEFDILDGSPVYDIKPYVPAYDSFPQSKVPPYAVPETRESFAVTFSPEVEDDLRFLLVSGAPDIRNFCLLQLSTDPVDRRRKRVRPVDTLSDAPADPPGRAAVSDAPALYELCFRMWRIQFVMSASARSVHVLGIASGYSEDELALPDDPHADKREHRQFVARSRP